MKAILLALLLAAALVGHASADPITMTFTDTGASLGGGNTISVGGQTVTNAPFTITVVSDTNNRITNPPSLGALAGFTLDSIRASISIAELGTFDFITPTRVNLIAPPNFNSSVGPWSWPVPTT